MAVASAGADHWFNLGYLYERNGAAEPAEAAFRRALALAPHLDLAWFGLARVLRRQLRWPEALAALEENNRLQPLSPHGWVEMADLLHVWGRADEARRVLTHLQTFEPKAAHALRQAWAAQPESAR